MPGSSIRNAIASSSRSVPELQHGCRRSYAQNINRPSPHKKPEQGMNEDGDLTLQNKFLLVSAARTALPSDLLRTLKEIGAVDRNMPVTNISSPPVSLPRVPRPYKTFHVSFFKRSDAEQAYDAISRNPFFFPREKELRFTDQRADQYADRLMQKATREITARWRRFKGEEAKSSSQSPSSSFGSLTERLKGQPGPAIRDFSIRDARISFNRPWMRRVGGSGRIVEISGLPYVVRQHQVQDFVADRFFGVAGSINYKHGMLEHPSPEAKRNRARLPLITGTDQMCILPSMPASGRYGLIFNTVEDAGRAARQVNMTRFTTKTGKPSVVRASVVW